MSFVATLIYINSNAFKWKESLYGCVSVWRIWVGRGFSMSIAVIKFEVITRWSVFKGKKIMIRKWCSDFQISCIYHVLICQKLMFGVCLRSLWLIYIFFVCVPITQQLTELLTAQNSFWYNTDTNDYLLFLMCKTYNVCLTVSLLERALAMLVWVWLLFLFFKCIHLMCIFWCYK